MVWHRDELAKKRAKRLGIDAWVSICQYVSISWETWISLDELTKRAIGLEVEELSKVRQQSVREQESKLENLLTKESMSLKFPTSVNSSIGHLMR
jgi:hypothetical protein